MSNPPVFGVIGATLWGNRGAEAMLTTTIGELRARFPNARFVIFSYTPKQDRLLLQPDPTITIAAAKPLHLVLAHFPFALLSWLLGLVRLKLPDTLLPKTARLLRSCNALLDISGISYADGREKFIPFNILNQWPAHLFKVPIIKLAQAMGPFQNPFIRLAAKLFMPRSQRLFARGKITASYLQTLPLNPELWELSADIAFLYRPEYSLSVENEPRISAIENRLSQLKAASQTIIGIAPSALVYQKSQKKGTDYIGQLLQLIDHLQPDQHVVLIPNATRENAESVHNNDIYVIDFVRQRAQTALSPEVNARIHYIDFDLNTSGSRRIIALCDALVTSRFHGMISGLSLNIPTAVIGWSHKYAEVLAEFNMEHFAIDFNDPHLDITQLFNSLIGQQDLQTQLQTGLTQAQALASKQFDYIKDSLS